MTGSEAEQPAAKLPAEDSASPGQLPRAEEQKEHPPGAAAPSEESGESAMAASADREGSGENTAGDDLAEDESAPPDSRKKHSPGFNRVRRGLILLSLVVAGVLFWKYRHLLTLQAVADHEAWLRARHQQSPGLFVAAVFGVYVAVTGTSLPGATVLTLAVGWFFGFWPALVLVSFASTAGASTALLLSRYLLRDMIQHRFHRRLKTFNEALRDEGAFYLFTLRLTPVVPFFVVNLVMGLTPMKLRTFWLVSQLGMLPGTCIYTWAGASIPSAERLATIGPGEVLSPRVIAALVLLGLFPLVMKKLLGWLAPKALETVENSQS